MKKDKRISNFIFSRLECNAQGIFEIVAYYIEE